MMHRRFVFFFLSLTLLFQAPGLYRVSFASAEGWDRTWSKVPTVVLVGPENDPQLQPAFEAIDFWNRTFAELGTPFKLGPIVQKTAPVSVRDLEALSAKMVDSEGPARLPEGIVNLPGDLIVVFSEGDFISFTARSRTGTKIMVGIKSDRFYPMTLPNVFRNVITHELGHAIGLHHNDDPATLMCGRPASCRPAAFEDRTEGFFPLTEREKTMLSAMYPANWPRHREEQSGTARK